MCHILTRKGSESSYQSKRKNSTCRDVCASSGTAPGMMMVVVVLLLLERVQG